MKVVVLRIKKKQLRNDKAVQKMVSRLLETGHSVRLMKQ